MKYKIRIAACVLVAVGLWVSSSWAQQESPTTTAPQAQPGTKQENSQAGLGEQGSSSSEPGFTIPMSSDPSRIREIGRAALLPSDLGRLRWGPIYLRSVEFLQVLSRVKRGFGGGNELNVVTSLFQATFALDKHFRRSEFALQYRPRVAITNGRTYTDFSNQDIQFDTRYSYQLSPRWSMSIAEGLAYRATGNLYTDPYISADIVSGTTVQNNFLEGPFESLSSSTSLTLVHPLSARTRLTFGPTFSFAYSSGGYQQSTPISSPTYRGVASLEHTLSPTRGVGVSYSVERIVVSQTFASTTYQTVAASYSQQLAPTWRVNLSLGASTADFPGRRQWNASGNFNLFKAFQRSYLSLTYSRGHTFSGYVNNGETQRADLSYGSTVTRRMAVQLGAGYEHTSSTLLAAGAPRVKVSGSYATAQVSYQLFPRISWFAFYARRKQISYDPQVFPGNPDFLVTGVSWNPGSKSSY